MVCRIRCKRLIRQCYIRLRPNYCAASAFFASPSSSHIIPIIVGESQAAVEKAREVQAQGFYIMPMRPPTVPQHSSRLRISLTALIQKSELEQLVQCL